MGKLIDADVFDSILQDAQAECKKNGGNFRFGVLNSVRANLANQPAVDAAPVVRCKDCGYFQANNAEEGDWSGRCTNVYVPMNGETVDGWWFCADGKREG